MQPHHKCLELPMVVISGRDKKIGNSARSRISIILLDYVQRGIRWEYCQLLLEDCIHATHIVICQDSSLQTGRAARVKIAVLLQGPTGSGKRTAAMQAAEAIGVHLIPLACEELRGPSDNKTAAAVKAAFETAEEFGPAILLLQNVPALLESQHPTGPSIPYPSYSRKSLAWLVVSSLPSMSKNSAAFVCFAV